ncbi:SRPBCC family protein [bacterium]|nr:SRPBCC family protein [bacterium]
MDTITVCKELNATPQKAWETAMQPHLLASEMPGVEEVSILSKKGGPHEIVQSVKWKGVIEAGPIRKVMVWIEKDLWTQEPLRCTFEQTEGSFKVYKGVWTFAPEGEGTLTTLTLEYDAGIPLVGAIVKKLLRKLIAENLQALLDALSAVL